MSWRKWWLLLAVIWVVVAAMQVSLILTTSEETGKALQPTLFGVAVPVALYFIGWIWERLRRKPKLLGGHCRGKRDDQLLELARIGVELADALGELLGAQRVLVVQPAERLLVEV